MKKHRIHKTYSVDSDICERWEELMFSQGKSFSECIEDSMRQDIESYEENKNSACQAVRLSERSFSRLPVHEEFNQFEKDHITPILDKETLITEEEGRQVRLLGSMLERAAANIKNKLKLNRIVIFPDMPKHNNRQKRREKGGV
jgi:hypothetical protein